MAGFVGKLIENATIFRTKLLKLKILKKLQIVITEGWISLFT